MFAIENELKIPKKFIQQKLIRKFKFIQLISEKFN